MSVGGGCAGLVCRLSLAVGSFLFIVMHTPLVAVASHFRARALAYEDSVAVAHGLSFSMACGIVLVNQNHVSCIGRSILKHWTSREAQCVHSHLWLGAQEGLAVLWEGHCSSYKKDAGGSWLLSLAAHQNH